MNCEICGREIEKRIAIELDGLRFIVCEGCSTFGREIPEPEAKTRKAPSVGKPSWERGPEPDLGLDVVADYGNAIRKAREKKGLTVEELAKKIFEKTSTLHRVESQALSPSDELISKLESELGISLKEEIPDEAREKPKKVDAGRKITLSDIAWKKKKV